MAGELYEHEVRFAIVMYGGVSLAIYINGVAQELLHLVRATAPGPDGGLHLSDDELTACERVYREVGRRLAVDGSWTAAGDTVQSRFVVDVLSGTSAGGINAIFLAKALANGQEIAGLKQLWVEDGDIESLFNEAANYAGLPAGVKFTKPPPSLLIGQRLYVKAHEALAGMGAGRSAGAPSYAEQVDLAVTTTDLQGLVLPIQLADGSVREPRHRTQLRFVYATGEATGQARNDFDGNDDLLAFAARATSSFPFAFEPVELRDVDQAVPGALERIMGAGERFFGDYVRANAEYDRFAFADGGYLDNKPFTGATDTLRRRRADVPVTRKLLYIEPDPAGLGSSDPAPAKPRPDAVGNAADALLLPRNETIREDIAALRERNAVVQRVRRVTREVELEALSPGASLEAGPALELAYLRLRRLQVIDDLTDLVVRAIELWPDGDRARAVRLLIDAWAPDQGSALADFVEDFDLGYRLREIEMLQDRINVLLRGGPPAERLLAAAGSAVTADEARTEGAEWLRARKRGLNGAFVELRRRGRQARSRGQQTGSDIGGAAAALRLDGDDLDFVIAGDDPLARAGELLAQRGPAIEAFADALMAHFDPAFTMADATIEAELAAPGATGLAMVLTASLRCTEAVDMAVLPLTYPDLGEVNAVEIHRVSPEDAESLVKAHDEHGRSRLAGAAVGHFGGFLDERWRRTDLMWGRLDGAERLLTALVPDAAARDELRIRAQAAILREEVAASRDAVASLLDPAVRDQLEAKAGGGDAELLEFFSTSFRGAPELGRDRTLLLAGHGLSITGDVLADAARHHGALGKPVFWAARLVVRTAGWLVEGVRTRSLVAVAALAAVALVALAVVGLVQLL